jgi:hypothetical protein
MSLFNRYIAFQDVNNSETDLPEARRYFQTECRKGAEEIVHFISSLRKENFQEFWLPCKDAFMHLLSFFLLLHRKEDEHQLTTTLDSAFHLTSTATLLVRCALETSDPEVARTCLSNVESFREILRRVREEYDWDVADMCLDHCERILTRLPPGTDNSGATVDASNNGIIRSSGGNAVGVGVNGLMGPPDGGANRLVNPAAISISLPETQTNNDIVDDMMSISGTFGTMDGFPFDMTGIWDVSVFQDVNLG